MNVQQSMPGTAGLCVTHGVYTENLCPKCAITSAKAGLRQSVWEADQFLAPDEIREFVESVIREIESDAA